jgi:hypothetical protein
MLTDDLLNGVPSIAAFLNMTERSTYHMLHTGKLPAFKKGGRWYARKSEIDAAFRSDAANG